MADNGQHMAAPFDAAAAIEERIDELRTFLGALIRAEFRLVRIIRREKANRADKHLGK